jgi:hypothetical protein
VLISRTKNNKVETLQKPSDRRSFFKFEAVRGAYEELKCVYPDRGGG